MREKLTVRVVELTLSGDYEYDIEEIKRLVNVQNNNLRNYDANQPIEKITIESETYYDYGETYSQLLVKGYRFETDSEFNRRIKILEEKEQKALAKKELDAEKARKKKEIAEQLAVDPEYQKYLQLKKKFK